MACRGTCGRVGWADVREWKNTVSSVNNRGGSPGSGDGFGESWEEEGLGWWLSLRVLA